jgi:hypothetical protein
MTELSVADTIVHRPRVWPRTLAVVLAGLTLLAWDLWAATITTAPFFGEQPSGDDLIAAGMALLTALVPAGLLVVLGLLAGSRFGLLALLLPGALLAAAGADLLDRAGTSVLAPRQAVPADVLAQLTSLNWLAAGVVLIVVVVALVRRRHRDRAGPVNSAVP